MSNPTRLLYKNLARLTGIAASASAAGYPAANLLTTDKADTWRATGTTATLSGSSATLRSAAGLILARWNGSPTATGRLTLYSDQGATDPVLDTGVKLLNPAPAIELEGWTAAQAASAYAYGGGTDGALWFNATNFRAWKLEISDASNLQGYLEACYLMLGPTWSPEHDIESAAVKLASTDVQFRSGAGSLKARAGIKYREIPLDFSLLQAADLADALRLLRGVGKTNPVGVAVYPDDTNLELDRLTKMVGLLTEDSEMALNGPDMFATRLTLAEI